MRLKDTSPPNNVAFARNARFQRDKIKGETERGRKTGTPDGTFHLARAGPRITLLSVDGQAALCTGISALSELLVLGLVDEYWLRYLAILW